MSRLRIAHFSNGIIKVRLVSCFRDRSLRPPITTRCSQPLHSQRTTWRKLRNFSNWCTSYKSIYKRRKVNGLEQSMTLKTLIRGMRWTLCTFKKYARANSRPSNMKSMSYSYNSRIGKQSRQIKFPMHARSYPKLRRVSLSESSPSTQRSSRRRRIR